MFKNGNWKNTTRDSRLKCTDFARDRAPSPSRDTGEEAQPAEMSTVLTQPEMTAPRPHCVAGAPGFEPGNGGIKSTFSAFHFNDHSETSREIRPACDQ